MLFLLAVGEVLTPKCPLLVKQATALVKIFCWVLLFQLHSDHHCWRSCRRILLGSSLGHVVGKILVEIIRIVVICKDRWTKRGVNWAFFKFLKQGKTTLTYAKLVRLNSPTG